MDIKYRLDIRKDSYIEVAKAVKGYKGSKLDADKFNSLSQEERIKQLRLKSKEVFDLGKRNIRCLSKEHEDKTPSMGFCEDTGGFHCFACGCSFDIIDIIGTAFHLKSFGEKYKKAVQLLVEFGADTAYHPKFKNWKGNSSQSYSKNSTYTSTYNGKKNRSSSYDDVPKAMQKALHNPHYYKISDFSYKKSSECLGVYAN